MPYIPFERRVLISLDGHAPQTVGELNYAITDQCLRFLQREDASYANINDVIGALECAKLELYRRVAVPYEDEKCKQNGDVY